MKKYAADPVLDVGCATGDYVRWLNAHGYGYTARGVDIRQYAEWDNSAIFTQSALPDLPHAANDFETVLCFEVIEHVADYHAALCELRLSLIHI